MAIPLGHKLATCAIAKDEPVRKYNTIIGYATRDVVPGTHMHNDTIRFDRVEHPTDFCEDYHPVELLAPEQRRTFRGYVRPDGRVGTCNYIPVVVSNCAATGRAQDRRTFHTRGTQRLSEYGRCCAAYPTLGCGMEKGTALAMTYLRRVIAGHIRNPNMAGALVCALGCENNNIDVFFEAEGFVEGPMLHKLTIQDMGAPEAVRRGIAIVGANAAAGQRLYAQRGVGGAFEHWPAVRRFRRVFLRLGQPRAGKSDGYSCAQWRYGLPLRRRRAVQCGGSARPPCQFPRETGERLLAALQWWLDYCKGKDMQINGKVTPGNNAGGLTNILEKAMGSVKKGGSTPLNAVYGYAEQITEHGLVIMDAPSYDPVSATAQFAGGCNLCIFTTGRGSCYGSRYFPTIKVASIRSCLPECRKIWTSTPVRSSMANRHWSRWARRFLNG